MSRAPIFSREPRRTEQGISGYLDGGEVNWDSALESLHADSTETHFMDVLTRQAVFDAVRRSAVRVDRVLEVGCSSGFMLAELRRQFREAARVLRPGGVLVAVIPHNPALYDYYDEHLSHERRYRRREPTGLAERAGVEVLEERYLGQFVYPPFWAVKKRNRRLGARLSDAERAARVAANVNGTGDSRVGTVTAKVELALLRRGIGLPFGIRQMVVARRP